MKRFLKRLRIKMYALAKRTLTPSRRDFTDSEIRSAAICRKLINHPDSIFLIAPLSHKRYIKNEPLGMFVILSDGKLNITNHVYNYDVMVPSVLSDKLCNMFDTKVESSRQKFESEMHGQIQHSLKTILDKLS
jgi:hypothetical protein